VLTVIADQNAGLNKINVSAAGAPGSGGNPTGSYTLSGVVADNGQPVANADVNAWIELPGGAGYSYWYLHGPLYSDASGGYRMPSLPGGVHVWIELYKDGYAQQCAASATISGDLTMDVALVSTAHLTASAMPSAPGLRSVSGTVVQMTATGLQPVAGASVSAGIASCCFSPDELAAAYTFTDATGRFALCGLSANDPAYLEAGTTGKSGYATVAPGQGDIQITLTSSGTSSMMALRPGRVIRR
jgi:hypothetical protein